MADETMIMATPAEVAARDGVTKQAVTKMVRQLVDGHALPVERDGRQRVIKFSLAHYDHLRSQFDSSAKVAAARTVDAPSAPAMPGPASSSRDEALRQEAWLKVSREKIRRQEENGQLVRADLLAQALTTVGLEIKAIVQRLQNRADDMALAVSREGAHGLRVMLRQVSFDLNQQIADKLAGIAEMAPASDDALDDGDEL
jgi:hypothetical protein